MRTVSLDAPDATPAERERGVGAAIDVFETAGVSSEAAAYGYFIRGWWDDLGFPEPAPAKLYFDWAAVMDEAEDKAIAACYRNRERLFGGAGLRVDVTDEDRGHFDADNEWLKLLRSGSLQPRSGR